MTKKEMAPEGAKNTTRRHYTKHSHRQQIQGVKATLRFFERLDKSRDKARRGGGA